MKPNFLALGLLCQAIVGQPSTISRSASELIVSPPEPDVVSRAAGPHGVHVLEKRLACQRQYDEFKMVARKPLSEFQELRNMNPRPERYQCYDWESNGCSIVPDRPLWFNFLPACQRHDFCYANLHLIEAWSDDEREECDYRFLRECVTLPLRDET